MFEDIIQSIVQIVSGLGYVGIIIMMFLESTFFPFPSEVVMIPAGYLASQHEMNLFIVIVLGTFGSVTGALFNYYLARKLGRGMLLRFGKWFFFGEKEMQKMEHFFQIHGSISTFVGRLLPGIRQYISLPAGLAKMPVKCFMVYTFLGALIWSTVLALLGYYIGENKEAVASMLSSISWILVGILMLLILFYILRHKRKQKGEKLL